MSATAASSARPVGKLIARFTAVAAAALGVATVAATIGVGPASASVHNWVMTGWGIHLTNQIDPATASHFFNTNTSYGTGPNSTGNPIGDGFNTNGVLAYTSYAQFASDIQNRAISSNYKSVLYDPEMWSQTPVGEQQNPVLYMKLFAQLAHANGYSVIEVPARDLAQVPGSACPQLPGENLDHWFVRCNIAGAAAAYADVVVLQDQVNTTNLAEFDYPFHTTHNQALAANPRIQFDAEVSTNYGTVDQMAAAARSVSADGYYINETTPAIAQAGQFLQEMQAAGY
ncbi:MAG TPA: hypothetical protein VGY50_02690 [Streptosporangiaceae bacterium]|nr:hypothetical protein [Streptosporangiaceae bacterium]